MGPFFVDRAVEKQPFAVVYLLFVTAAYEKVRLILHDFMRLASGHF